MPTFHVGQKVVCIDDRFRNVSIDQGIRKGQVYTVRWAGHYRHYVDGDFYGVKLMELYRGNDDGPEGYGAVDMPFRATRFRPLVSDRIRQQRLHILRRRVEGLAAEDRRRHLPHYQLQPGSGPAGQV